MSKPTDGGPAFPTENARQTGPNSWHYEGMTIRQYYKAKIAAGMMANSLKDERAGEWLLSFTISEIAAYCGQLADALIAEDEEFETRGSE